MKHNRILALFLVLLLLMPSLSFADVSGDLALEHVRELSDVIGARVVGTPQEIAARDYVFAQLESFGYSPELQKFEHTRRGVTYTSYNVIAVKPGRSDKQVIIGAHYDSVAASKGADDNASGTAVLLETAERLAQVDTTYTLVFIGFGAEEVGLKGSNYYVEQLSDAQKQNILAMVNIDTILAGDFMYVYSGLGGQGWVRDQAFEIAKLQGLDITTNPGLNPDYPEGETGDWSDHAPFHKEGIPVLYLESTNWFIGSMDGYDQTEAFGPIMHSKRDNLDWIMENLPGRAEERLSTFSTLLFHLLVEIHAPDQTQDVSKHGVILAKDSFNENATIPFKFATLNSDGEKQPMQNITLRIFDRNKLVASFSEGKGASSLKALGKKGDYMVNINGKQLGLEAGFYTILVEYIDGDEHVITSSYFNID